jgi:hypothetical protein
VSTLNILDCESADSIYESFRSLFGVGESTIKASFATTARKHLHFDSATDDELILPLEDRIATEEPFDATYWFHLTRTIRSNTFAEGILPLGNVLDSLWDMLFGFLGNTFPLEKWSEFRQGMEFSYCEDTRVGDYRLKVHDPFYWGPYAYLIRERTIQEYGSSRLETHYLYLPEVIENICVPFKNKFDIDLPQIFLENTSPCIVKFIARGSKISHLLAALRYLYFVHNRSNDFVPNPIHSGMVTHDQIVSVEFVEELLQSLGD